MRLDAFNYILPDDRIAQTPLEPRDSARLLHVNPRSGSHSHLIFHQLTELLKPGDLLVINETRVSAVRLVGEGPGGGYREALVLAPHLPGGPAAYEALVRPGKAARPGDTLHFADTNLTCTVGDVLTEGIRVLHFHGDPDTTRQTLETQGRVPLPPYIHEHLDDRERYQTVYNRVPGSAAAPTAGLHFTAELLDTLAANGIETARVLLSVGLGTFRPIKSTDDITKHPMHAEYIHVTQETADKVNACTGRVIAIGTTSLRALETAARNAPDGVRVAPFDGDTNIFIYPGQKIRSVDGLLTNFHQPGSTLLLLVATLLGIDGLHSAYDAALANDYRFLSFGDAMLILPDAA